MTRRLVWAVIMILVASGSLLPGRGIADSDPPAGTRAGEWAAGEGLSAMAAEEFYAFTSAFPANALMVHWARDGAPDDVLAEVSVSQDGEAWSAWTPAPADEDSDGPRESDRTYTGAIFVDPSRYIRVQMVNSLGQPGVSVPDLRVTYLNTLSGPETNDPVLGAASSDMAAAAEGVTIIPRSGWGADEALRFQSGKERWPREYQIPEKVVLHHTETPNDQDPMAGIRAVYYFHAVTRGWGDIGYNYLVDRNGRIYEGRAGGDNVIGGHALAYNRGSIGIAVLGSYQKQGITAAAEQSIVNLITAKARYIDPIGKSWFIDKVLPNIAGHRDCLSTSCPGDAFYPRLPAIRDQVLQQIGYRPTKDIRITDVKIGPPQLSTGQRVEVNVTVQNTGSSVLPSDARGPGVQYREGQTYDDRGLPKVTGKFRIGLEVSGTTGDRYPYRWGFGRALLPGESVTVTGYLNMLNPQSVTFNVALVEEYVKYWEQGVGATQVTVVGPPVQSSPPDTAEPSPPVQVDPLPTERKGPPSGPENDRMYFQETAQYLQYGFKYYWEHNGGLARFGLPLTSEYREINPEDGKEYTVQYFERARFEYHPEHQGTPYETLLGLLGKQTTSGRIFAVSPSSPSQPGGRYFPETQQWVSGPILKYWEENGGLMIFGYPISPAFEEVNPDDGKTYLVQYFERNRFEYHPEFAGTPNEVLLGLLGRQVLVDRGWLTR